MELKPCGLVVLRGWVLGFLFVRTAASFASTCGSATTTPASASPLRLMPCSARQHLPPWPERLLLKANNGANDGLQSRSARRPLFNRTTAVQTLSLLLGAAALSTLTRPAWAKTRSRTDGYSVQKSESEWKSQLSQMQYFVLREGGTERPNYSILESEDRNGVFKCAGCGSPLFRSSDKFHSGTGWPSFARGLDAVEVEDVDPFQAKFGGAELRCGTCGGHLGDVFQDGFLFVGTPAAETNRRYCIDGAALVFYPIDADRVRGDASKVNA